MYQKKSRITTLDIVVITLIFILSAYIIYRLTTKLNYKWNWGIIPQYLYYYDAEKGRWTANVLMQGLYTTIRLSVWATLLATIFGTVAGVLRTTPRGACRRSATQHTREARQGRARRARQLACRSQRPSR